MACSPALAFVSNCLKNEGIGFVGEFAQKREAELLRKSLDELEEISAQIGLHVGLATPQWPPPNIEVVSQQAGKVLERVDELELTSIDELPEERRGQLRRRAGAQAFDDARRVPASKDCG